MKVIVIGGGIVGTSAAYHLARKGVATTLIDGGHRGRATDAGAGVVFPWPFPWQPRPVQEFAFQAAAHYPGLMRDLAEDGQATGYAEVGGISAATDSALLDRDFDLLRELHGRPGYTGLGEIRRLPVGAPREMFPVLSADYGGVHVSGMARMSGRHTRDALFNAAEERGLRYRKGDAELVAAGGRATGVTLAGEELHADAVIIAAGAWTAPLLGPLGIDAPVRPVRGQIVHAALPGERTRDWPVVRFPEHEAYLLAFPPDRVVLSGTREPDAGFDPRATVAGVAQVLDRAMELAPGLAEATVADTRVGFRPAGADGHQLLGPLGALPNAVVATGLGSEGLTFGPYQGAVAARLAMGESPDTDLSLFRPDRDAG